MPIAVDIDVMLARRKMSVGELADRVGITPANLAVLKNGRAKAVRFATLAALCEELNCQPGDLLRWEADNPQVGRRPPASTCRQGAPNRLRSTSHAVLSAVGHAPNRALSRRAPQVGGGRRGNASSRGVCRYRARAVTVWLNSRRSRRRFERSRRRAARVLPSKEVGAELLSARLWASLEPAKGAQAGGYRTNLALVVAGAP